MSGFIQKVRSLRRGEGGSFKSEQKRRVGGRGAGGGGGGGPSMCSFAFSKK